MLISGSPSGRCWDAGNKVTSAQLESARRHLEKAVVKDPNNVDARVLLGRVYRLTNKPDDAIPHFRAVISERPEVLIEMAQAFATLGRNQEAREQAEAAVALFSRTVTDSPEDIKSRLLWSQAHRFLKEYPAAAQILLQGMKRVSDNRFRLQIAKVYVAWSDNTPDDAARLQLLQTALSYNPAELEALKRIAPYALHETPEAEQVRAELIKILKDGKAQPLVHLIMGTLEIQKDNLESARIHLEQAYAQNDRMPAVVNNLAWLLARVKPPELERALRLANEGVALMPGNAEMRETRGAIHFKLDNWRQAITDLEVALTSFPERTAILELLAGAYDELGEVDVAAAYRERLGRHRFFGRLAAQLESFTSDSCFRARVAIVRITRSGRRQAGGYGRRTLALPTPWLRRKSWKPMVMSMIPLT